MADYLITREAINAYADLTHDRNPLHVDDKVAATSPLGGVVAHGFLLLGGALTVLGRRDAFPKRFECRFHAPGRPGTTIATVVGEGAGFEVRAGDQVLVTGKLA